MPAPSSSDWSMSGVEGTEIECNEDMSPCRWAAAFEENAPGSSSSGGQELIDLPLEEQISRGQELLRLLWEPVTPSTPAANSTPAPALAPQEVSRSSCAGLAPSPRADTSRSRPQHVLSLTECLEDPRFQYDAAASSEQSCASTLKQPRAVSEQRCLELSDLLDCKLCPPRSETPHALSDASTATPRDPEDVSLYEGVNMAALMPAMTASSKSDAWQHLQAGRACVPSQEQYGQKQMPMNQGSPQLPLPSNNVNGQMWPMQWQWPTPVMGAPAATNLIAPQFSGAATCGAPPGFGPGQTSMAPCIAPIC